MATKWKKFKTDRAVKAVAVILYIVCFAAVGIIASYTSAFGYVRASEPYGSYGIDALLADDYHSSVFFTDNYSRDFESAELLINEYRCEKITAERYSEELKSLQLSVEWQLNSTFGGNTGVIPPYFSICWGRYGVVEEGTTIPLDEIKTNHSSPLLFFADDYIQVGYTEEQYNRRRDYWLEMRRNMQIVVVSAACLLVIGILLFVFICMGAGERADGSVSCPIFFRLYYEISLAAFAASLVGVFLLTFTADFGLIGLCGTANGRALFMAVCGGLTALCFMILLYFGASLAMRIKSRTFVRGSLILLAVIGLFRLIKPCGRWLKKCGKQILRGLNAIKELLTGEGYIAPAAKKLLIMDIITVALAAALTVGLVFTMKTEVREINLLPFILIIAVLAAVFILFFRGRYYILRDGAALEKQIEAMHSGDDVSCPELCKNSPYAESCEKLSEMSGQYRRSLEEQVKSERTKIELVTNVSHDLKTPLTSIIGYIDLLSKEELQGDAAEYVEILRSKSERLKNIVSDVFELAKTTSGEIAVEQKPLDLAKLSIQTLAELEDKIAESGLEVKTNICEPPVTVISDGKRLYRVIQNLLDNALKYSLKGTRIYYTLEKLDESAVITIKNISAYEMDFTKEEIMERFTRGDKSRSTEGTGLGLSIAQGFTLACGGQFDIEIDGDMFKSIVTFPLKNND